MTVDVDAASLLRLVRDVPDQPQPGVLFKDITPLLADARALAAVVRGMTGLVAGLPGGVDAVAGVEARGFVLGAPVALACGAGFVPVRKAGKLPGRSLSLSYALEYGSAELEVHADAFTAGQQVVVVDDVLATGGTAAAACELVEQAGGGVVAVLFLLEISGLGGRDRLSGRDVHTLLSS